jgi:glycine oxidase
MPGLWLACGHHRNGVLLAAITAELSAGGVMKKTPNAAEEALLGAFRWNRFEN